MPGRGGEGLEALDCQEGSSLCRKNIVCGGTWKECVCTSQQPNDSGMGRWGGREAANVRLKSVHYGHGRSRRLVGKAFSGD